MSTGMIIDGIASTPDIDSSGEILDLEGADVTDLEEGRGLYSYEHKNAGGDDECYGQEIVGKILTCKKIFKASDCENDRHKLFFEKAGGPYLYVIGRLLDGAGHKGAEAIAAAIRDSVANEEPLVISYSVEGSTLQKEGNVLKKTVVRRVAITWRPCLKTTEMGLVEDPNAPQGFSKKPGGSVDIAGLVSKDEKDPLFTRLGGHSMEYGPEMFKAMSAGIPSAAPGALTGGAALQREDRGPAAAKIQALSMAAFRDWDKVQPFKKFLKARLPEVSDEYVDHFSDIVDRHLYRVRKAEEYIQGLRKSDPVPRKDWLHRNQPQDLPDDSPEHFKRLEEFLRVNPNPKAPKSNPPTPVQDIRRAAQELILKCEDLGVELALAKVAPEPAPEPQTVEFQGKTIKPGRGHHNGKPISLLHASPTEFTAVPRQKLSAWAPEDLIRIPKQESKSLVINGYPEDLSVKGIADSRAHGVHIHHEDIHQLVNGLDFTQKQEVATGGTRPAWWGKNAEGKSVYVKRAPDAEPFGENHREAAYHNLARDFFGLGNYLPRTGVVAHPQTGEEHAVSEFIDGQHFNSSDPQHQETLKGLSESGELDKLSAMNLVLGNSDRHRENWMITNPQEGGRSEVKLIDHGLAFYDPRPAERPSYQQFDELNDKKRPVHPEAVKYIQGLSPEKLQQQLLAHGVPQEQAMESVSRLRALQAHLKHRPDSTTRDAWALPIGMAEFSRRNLLENKTTRPVHEAQ